MAETPRKVVLAVDASSVSKDAVEWATKQLLRPGDEVHFLSVLEPLARSDYAGSSEGSVAIGEGSQVRRLPSPSASPANRPARTMRDRPRSRRCRCRSPPPSATDLLTSIFNPTQCQPDPLALERTQKAIKEYTELAEARGVRHWRAIDRRRGGRAQVAGGGGPWGGWAVGGGAGDG